MGYPGSLLSFGLMSKINIACFGRRWWVGFEPPVFAMDGHGVYKIDRIHIRTVQKKFCNGGHYSVLEADYIIRIDSKEMVAWAEII